MLTRILYIPFSIAALIFLYFAWEKDSIYYWHLLVCTLMLMALYMMNPQINWWWYQRFPPDLPAAFQLILNARMPFYQKLAPSEKKRFRNRAAQYIEANEFIGKGMEKVPIDLKAAAACSVAQLTFGLDDYLLSKFEHIVIYAHPFPSPQHPEHWHSSEIFEEDGVILFSAEQLMPGFLEPARYFNIGLYEYARVYQICYPDVEFPEFQPSSWYQFELISGFKKETIHKWIGLPEVDIVAVAVVLFFVFRERFQKVFPAETAKLKRIFGVRI